MQIRSDMPEYDYWVNAADITRNLGQLCCPPAKQGSGIKSRDMRCYFEKSCIRDRSSLSLSRTEPRSEQIAAKHDDEVEPGARIYAGMHRNE